MQAPGGSNSSVASRMVRSIPASGRPDRTVLAAMQAPRANMDSSSAAIARKSEMIPDGCISSLVSRIVLESFEIFHLPPNGLAISTKAPRGCIWSDTLSGNFVQDAASLIGIKELCEQEIICWTTRARSIMGAGKWRYPETGSRIRRQGQACTGKHGGPWSGESPRPIPQVRMWMGGGYCRN